MVFQAVFGSDYGERASQPRVLWHDDYYAAMDVAQSQSKLALAWFYDPRTIVENQRFETEVLSQAPVAELIAARCVAMKLPLDAVVVSDGEEGPLLAHAAFAEMQRWPGLALIDMTDEKSPLFRQVVSVYPFVRGGISAEKLAVLFDVPRGTLTQRTLIFAVRTHAEQPASAASHLSMLLANEAESHAAHQARITLQGHHQWESRFSAINARLPGGLVAQEVCAESWPGQGLVEAAEECVESWRQSPGHWDAVSQRHTLFGYDMKRGANGVWYATGIFARRH